jgi:hypothetical protein
MQFWVGALSQSNPAKLTDDIYSLVEGFYDQSVEKMFRALHRDDS